MRHRLSYSGTIGVPTGTYSTRSKASAGLSRVQPTLLNGQRANDRRQLLPRSRVDRAKPSGRRLAGQRANCLCAWVRRILDVDPGARRSLPPENYRHYGEDLGRVHAKNGASLVKPRSAKCDCMPNGADVELPRYICGVIFMAMASRASSCVSGTRTLSK